MALPSPQLPGEHLLGPAGLFLVSGNPSCLMLHHCPGHAWWGSPCWGLPNSRFCQVGLCLREAVTRSACLGRIPGDLG